VVRRAISSDRAHVLLRGGCYAAFSALCAALMDAAGKIGWLPRSLKMRHPHVSRRGGEHTLCHGRFFVRNRNQLPVMARDNPRGGSPFGSAILAATGEPESFSSLEPATAILRMQSTMMDC